MHVFESPLELSAASSLSHFGVFWYQNGESSISAFKDPNLHTFHFCYNLSSLHFLRALFSLHYPFVFFPSTPLHGEFILLLGLVNFQPVSCFVFSTVFFTGEQSSFLFCNFLISGCFAFWVCLIRRKNWWGGVSFGSYWTGCNGSDLILSGSSEGLILLIFMAIYWKWKKFVFSTMGKYRDLIKLGC